MKVAVINFSGNVGKTTVSRHLVLPRIPDAELITIESLNADEGQTQAHRGRQFAELQEYLHTVDNAVVDIGASNVEELLKMMQLYRGSHEDFDYFVVPTVPPVKQQKDTVATLAELSQIGVVASRLRIVFNMAEVSRPVEESFHFLLAFLKTQPLAATDPACRMDANEIYARLRGAGADLSSLAQDQTDYKSLIAKAVDRPEKIALAQKLATRRLASGVVPELDACFAALRLGQMQPSPTRTAKGTAP